MFLFLPIGDHPNPPRPQWITRILLATNIAIYAFVSWPLSEQGVVEDYQNDPEARRTIDEMWEFVGRNVEDRNGNRVFPTREIWVVHLSRYDVFVYENGFKPGRPSLLALFFCMFLHGGFAHLAGNMLYLWIYGDNVEQCLGPVRFLLAYLGTGVVATLSFAVLAGDSMMPLVGASGAISGVLGFYLVWFPHNIVRVFLWLFVIIQVVYVRALWMLLMYFVLDNLLPFVGEQVGGRASGGVAFAAHIGGFVAGALIAYFWNRVKGPAPPPDFARPRGYRPAQPPPPRPEQLAGSRFEAALRAGDMPEAATSFALLVREGGEAQPESVYRLGAWLFEAGYYPDARAVFSYYLSQYPGAPRRDEVAHLLAEIG